MWEINFLNFLAFFFSAHHLFKMCSRALGQQTLCDFTRFGGIR